MFREYLNKPNATAKEFDAQGWFKTGDIALYDQQKAAYKILGRASVDIIKSAGYKISALEIEREILSHQKVRACFADRPNRQAANAHVRMLIVRLPPGRGSGCCRKG